jgi:hypothetical protein
MLKHYVRYLLPGVFMPEEETKQIKERDIKLALKWMPEGCYAFYFYSVETIKLNGETLRGNTKRESGRYYPGGQKIHWKDIPNTPENEILIGNVRRNGEGGFGIKTRVGNWQHWVKGDQIIPEA